MAVTLNFGINVTGSGNAGNEFKKVGDEAKKAGDKIKETGAKAQKASEDNLTFQGVAKGFVSGLIPQAAAMGTVFAAAEEAARKVAEVMQESFKIVVNAEKVLNTLSLSFKAAGKEAEQSTKEVAEWAETLERLSGIDSEQLISGFSRATQNGLGMEQSMKAVNASIGIAKATGKDFNEILAQLSLTTEGQRGRLQKIIPEIARMSDAMLFEGKAIDIANNKYKEFINGDINTIAGRMARVNIEAENFVKTLGLAFVEGYKTTQSVAELEARLKNVAIIAESLSGLFSGLGKVFGTTIDAIAGVLERKIMPIIAVIKGVQYLFSKAKEAPNKTNERNDSKLQNLYGTEEGEKELPQDKVKAQIDMQYALTEQILKLRHKRSDQTVEIMRQELEKIKKLTEDSEKSGLLLGKAGNEIRLKLIQQEQQVRAAAMIDTQEKYRRLSQSQAMTDAETVNQTLESMDEAHRAGLLSEAQYQKDLAGYEKERIKAAEQTVNDVVAKNQGGFSELNNSYQKDLMSFNQLVVAKKATVAQFERYVIASGQVRLKAEQAIERSNADVVNSALGDTYSLIENKRQSDLEKLSDVYEEQMSMLKDNLEGQALLAEQHKKAMEAINAGADNARSQTTGSESTDKTMQATTGMINAATSGANAVIMQIGAMFGPTGQLIAGLIVFFGMGKEAFAKMMDALLDALINIPLRIADNIGVFFDKILDAMPKIISSIMVAMVQIMSLLFSADFWGKILKGLWVAFKTMWENIFKMLFGGTIRAGVEEATANQKKPTVVNFGDADPNAGDAQFKIKDIQAKGAVSKSIEETVDTAVSATEEHYDGIFSKIGQVIWDGLKTAFLAGWQFFKDIGVAIWEGLIAFAKTMWSMFTDMGMAIWNGLWGGLKTIGGFFVNVGGQLWEAVKAPFSGLSSLLTDSFYTAVSALRGFLNAINPLNLLKKLFSDPGGSPGTVEEWMGINIPFIRFAEGGNVPGTAKASGNSIQNDIIPALLSPGEFVLPRSVTQDKNFMQMVNDKVSGKKGGGQFGDDAFLGVMGNMSQNKKVAHLFNPFDPDDWGDAFSEGADAFSGFGGAASEVWNGMTSVAQGAWSTLSAGGKAVWEEMAKGGKKIWAGAGGIAKGAVTGVENVGKGGWQAIRTVLGFLDPRKLFGTVQAVYEFLVKIGSDVDYLKMVYEPQNEAPRAFKKVSRDFFAPAAYEVGKLFGANSHNVTSGETVKSFGFNKGGVVPGSGSFDSIPAMLTPGEMVLPKSISQRLIASTESGSSSNVNITFNIAAGTKIDEQMFRRELVPKIMDVIKRDTQLGKTVFSKNGGF